jgi:hypothetical protein
LRVIHSLFAARLITVTAQHNVRDQNRIPMARPHRLRPVSFVSRAYSRDPLERIDSIGGVNSDRTSWRLSQAAAIAAIEAGTDEFYIRSGDQHIKLTVVSRGGEKYLQSEREKTHPDDLLDLVMADANKR